MARKRAGKEEAALEIEPGVEPEDSADTVSTLAELSRRIREKSPNGHRIDWFDDGPLMENLHLANAYYDRNLPGEPSAGDRAKAALYAPIKRLVRRLVGWYLKPALENQRLYNAYATRSINEMKRYLDHLQVNEDILSTIMHRDLALFRANILYLNNFLERRMLDFENELALLRGRKGLEPVADGAAPVNAGSSGGEPFADLDVLALEQRVHGTPRMVRDRQRVYLTYFRGRKNVLAIGCGRGELLQLFAEEGIGATGTETNEVLVNYCRDNGLSVSRVDPLEYVDSCEEGSLDGIVLSRFAGHQPPARLLRMLNLCRARLAEGSALVIETPNPFSLYAVASYALEDSSRMHPLHPETLKLLCLSSGFLDPTVMFLNPLPPEEHLEEIDLTASGAILDPREQELFHRVNENFDRINRILFSHRDYAVVARRGKRETL